MDIVSGLVGIDYEKMNCWDLARVFYSKAFDIDLMNVAANPKDRLLSQSLIFTNIGEFKRVTTPQFGDIILIKVRGIESHIAIYLDNGLMLHTTESTGSVIDRTERWDKTIVGYFRPSNVME